MYFPLHIVLLCQEELAHLAGTRFQPDLHPLGSGAPVQCEGRTGSHLQSHSNPLKIITAKWGSRSQSGFRARSSGKAICNPVRVDHKILHLCPKLYQFIAERDCKGRLRLVQIAKRISRAFFSRNHLQSGAQGLQTSASAPKSR